MAGEVSSAPEPGSVHRVLGVVRGARPGPTLVCVGGIHGNEPAGVLALQRVLGPLEERRESMAGDFVALAGNRAALAAGRRYVDRDLNRAWTGERIRSLRGEASGPGSVEDGEQLELLRELEGALDAARGPVYALDLHTTSGPGGIFSAFSDSLPQRKFAAAFPVPMVLGLEEQVDGTLLNVLTDHGFIAVTVESGQHDEPEAVDRAEAAIWIGVVASGLLSEARVPEAEVGRRLLRRSTAHLPRALEMRHRHPVEPGDGFRMADGHRNFEPVERGQVVARDDTGEIAVTERSRLLMPLYQDQGEDGFFLVREFRPFWMRVSHALRRVHADRFAVRLPGVRRSPGTGDEVVVDTRVARFFTKQLFHLLGFRQLEERGDALVLRRRRFDETRYLSRLPVPEHLDR